MFFGFLNLSGSDSIAARPWVRKHFPAISDSSLNTTFNKLLTDLIETLFFYFLNLAWCLPQVSCPGKKRFFKTKYINGDESVPCFVLLKKTNCSPVCFTCPHPLFILLVFWAVDAPGYCGRGVILGTLFCFSLLFLATAMFDTNLSLNNREIQWPSCSGILRHGSETLSKWQLQNQWGWSKLSCFCGTFSTVWQNW